MKNLIHFRIVRILYLTVLLGCGFSHAHCQTNPYPEISQIWGDQDDNKFEIPNKIIAAEDGSFIIAGQWQDSAWVRKITSCGASLWERKFLVGTKTGLNSICELPNGNLAVVGTCDSCVVGDSTQKAYIALMDPTGGLIADTLLGGMNLPANGNDIVVMKNGNIAVTGFVMVPGFLGPTNLLVGIFDANLDLIRYSLVNKNYLDVGHRIVATQDSGLAIAGYTVDFFFGPAYGTVFKCNALGDSVWVAKDTATNSEYLALTEAPNGDFVTAGRGYIDTIVGYDGYMTLVDGNNGQISSPHHFGSPANDELRDIHAVANGFLVGGSYRLSSGGWYGDRDWVLHLDPSLVADEVTFRDDELAWHELKSIVPLSPNGEDWAVVSRIWFFANQNALFVKHHRLGKELTFSEFPMDYQLYPRDANNLGHVSIIGQDLATGMQFDSVRVHVSRNDTLIATQSQLLNYGTGVAQFNLQFQVPAELANYQFNLTAVDASIHYPEASACDVLAGDAFMFSGHPQTFVSGIDSSRNYHANPFIRNYGLRYANDSVYTWHRESADANKMADPQSGDFGLVLADQIVGQQQVPVAIINGGIFATTIDSMLPGAPGDCYGKFLTRATKSGLKDHFRGLFFYQGEVDSYISYLDSLQSYRTKLQQLYTAWNLDFPNREHDYFFQIREPDYPGFSPLHNLQIAEAQRELADSFPNLEIMSSTGMNHDSLQYYYHNGVERAGNDIYRLVDRDIYGAPFANNIDAPNIQNVLFNCARTEVILQMRNPNDALTWYPDMESDFELLGAGSVTVVLGYILGNEIHLILSGVALQATTISYKSHPRGDRCSVKNANGIGMLRFYNQPILLCPVGIETNDVTLDISVYPNPLAGETLHIVHTAQKPGKLNVAVYTIDGKWLQGFKFLHGMGYEQHEFDLHCAPGVYILKATDEGGNVQVFRVVKL
jgi:hypothetical protein